MRIFAVIFSLAVGLTVTLALTGASVAQESQPTPDAATPASSTPPVTPTTEPAGAVNGPPQRVVLRVNRNTEIKGYVELEDENVIVVRDTAGDTHSFAKPRIGQIVRLTEPEAGQGGMVRMIDGQVRRGIIIEDNFDYVIIEIEGIRANLKRAIVDEVILEPTIDQTYAQYKKDLAPDNLEAHLILCQWLYERRRYIDSRVETLLLLEKSEMPEARRLLNLLDAQLALEGSPLAPGQSTSGNESDPESTQPTEIEPRPAPNRPREVLPDQILTEADVNIIRVYELDFDDPPRITITPDTVRELIEKYGTNSLVPASQTGRNSLFRAASDRPLDVVRLMFEIRARDLYGQIQVNSEPNSLNMFRRRVHDTWLINNCATNACHGGTSAGRFFLHRRDFKDERVRTTNLLILERLDLDPEWPLINYERPEDSVIIQYGLPRNFARKPHPLVDGWKSAFSPTNPKLLEDSLDWIRMMMQPRPEYPVDYIPPMMGGNRSLEKPASDNRVPR